MPNVQSVERAFSILAAIAAVPNGLGVTEIANRVSLPKSTVSRLLATLEGAGAVERMSDSEGFQIGMGIISLVGQLPYQQTLSTLARPFLQTLSEQLGEDVGLCVPDGDRVYYVDQVHSQRPVQVKDWTGSRFPLHVVSAGKLFLAYWPEPELERYLQRPLVANTARTLTQPHQLRQRLADIRATGIDWTFEEFAEGLNAASAPVHNERGQIVAAVNVYGPAFRFPPPNQQPEITQLVTTTARQITACLIVYAAKGRRR